MLRPFERNAHPLAPTAVSSVSSSVLESKWSVSTSTFAPAFRNASGTSLVPRL